MTLRIRNRGGAGWLGNGMGSASSSYGIELNEKLVGLIYRAPSAPSWSVADMTDERRTAGRNRSFRLIKDAKAFALAQNWS